MENNFCPNLLTICRLCLQENCAKFDIFKTPNLSLRIMTSTSLEMHIGDGLPNLICQDCRVQLEKSYMFRKRCQLSDSQLRKHIRLINSGKKSKIEPDEESLEFEESLKFISNFEAEQNKISEDKRKIREMEIYENAKFEETSRLLEEFKNFILLKSETKTSNANSKTLDHSRTEVQQKDEIDSPNSDIPKKNLYVFDENSEANELIFVVENPEDDEDNINVNEYDIQEENYESEFEEDCKDFGNNDADKEMNEMLQDIHCGLNETKDANETDNPIVDDDTSTIVLKENIKIDKPVSPKKITRAKVFTKDGNIIEMEVYNTANSSNINGEINIQAKTNDLNIFKCSLCPQSFTRRVLLERHASVHMKNKQYCCLYCKKWFACKSSLDRHTRIHTGEKPFECEHCGKKFVQREILKRHMYLHTKQKPFKCTHCNQSFVQKQVLQDHINLKHTDNPVPKTHDCFLCPKTFMHASGLSRHLLFHSGTSFQCTGCKKKFNDKSALKRHTNSVNCIKINSANNCNT